MKNSYYPFPTLAFAKIQTEQGSSLRFLMTTSDNTIKLDQFLKFVGIAQTGGQAKLMIQGGSVKVNEIVETRRGRKLVSGDRVTVGGQTFNVRLSHP